MRRVNRSQWILPLTLLVALALVAGCGGRGPTAEPPPTAEGPGGPAPPLTYTPAFGPVPSWLRTTRPHQRGRWVSAMPSPDGRTLLAQWLGECEIPVAYLVPLATRKPRPVAPALHGGASETVAVGWSADGRAGVFFKSVCGGAELRPGLYLVPPDGDREFVTADIDEVRRWQASAGSSSDQQLLADGRWFGYVRGVDTSASPQTIGFDVAEFLVGGAAQRAAAADGAISPGEPVSNDYYVRNPSKTVRTLALMTNTRVRVVRCPSSCSEGHAGVLADFLASFADADPKTLGDDYRGTESQYWVTLAAGRVVEIDEQYVP